MDMSDALNPSISIADTNFSGVCFVSSYATRACRVSSCTSARVTPGSLSKAAVIEAGQPLQTMPCTPMTAVFGAASTTPAASASSRVITSANGAIPCHTVKLLGMGHIPARR